MTFTISRKHIVALSLAVIALVTACDNPSEPTTPVGRYALASLNDEGIPAMMFEGEGYSLQTIHGTLELSADYSYVMAVTTLETVDNNESEYVDSLRGSWTLDAMNALQFTGTGSGSLNFPGSWQGRDITVLIPDGVSSSSYVFQRAQ